jgi:hypothetical protein
MGKERGTGFDGAVNADDVVDVVDDDVEEGVVVVLDVS